MSKQPFELASRLAAELCVVANGSGAYEVVRPSPSRPVGMVTDRLIARAISHALADDKEIYLSIGTSGYGCYTLRPTKNGGTTREYIEPYPAVRWKCGHLPVDQFIMNMEGNPPHDSDIWNMSPGDVLAYLNRLHEARAAIPPSDVTDEARAALYATPEWWEGDTGYAAARNILRERGYPRYAEVRYPEPAHITA